VLSFVRQPTTWYPRPAPHAAAAARLLLSAGHAVQQSIDLLPAWPSGVRRRPDGTDRRTGGRTNERTQDNLLKLFNALKLFTESFELETGSVK